MSTHKSYFSKNNTLISFSHTNTAKNPVTEIFYGGGASRYTCQFTGNPLDSCINENDVSITGHTRIRVNNSFSRFIFSLDVSDLQEKVDDKTIILSGGCGNSATTHTLRMVNTSTFDKALLNTFTAKNARRATSFELLLLKLTGTTSGDTWSEGVGYDYVNQTSDFPGLEDKSFSDRPSNWYMATTLEPWNCNGGYTWGGCAPVILARQTFDNGNENIEFDMTQEINGILSGNSMAGGYAIGFVHGLEELTGLTVSQSVGFFTNIPKLFLNLIWKLNMMILLMILVVSFMKVKPIHYIFMQMQVGFLSI